MRPCHVIEIVTPKKVLLNGLWLGPKRAKRVVVWVHGLGSSMFSKLSLAEHLVDSQTAILMFNNRGHDKVAAISTTGKRRIRGGAAHEVFTDCVDDIQGAINFAKKAGAKSIYLAGHSTGCQKSVYWGAKKGKGVKGIILLAPMSDYAAEVKISGKAKISRALLRARKLAASGRRSELLPENVWEGSLLADAQRFVSLYSGAGAEEIFTYWDQQKNPKTLRSMCIPTLVLLAENDEYADRPAAEIASWFERHAKRSDVITIVPKVKHSFKGREGAVVAAVRAFIKNT